MVHGFDGYASLLFAFSCNVKPKSFYRSVWLRKTKSESLQFVNSKCYPQGHLREGKCHLSLGNAMAASRSFQRVLELEADNSQAQQEVSLTQFNKA